MRKCEFGLVRAKDLKENGSEAERGEVMSTLTHTHTHAGPFAGLNGTLF